MAFSDQMQQIQTLVSETITSLGDGDTTAAKLKISQLRLLLATTPVEMRDDFAQLKMNAAGDINELLKSLEAQIAEVENGGELAFQRIPIDLGYECDEDPYPLC